MIKKLNRRHASAAIACQMIIQVCGPNIASAEETPLSERALEFGATIKAMCASEEPIRIAALHFQSAAFWDAVQQGIAEAATYLDPLNATVDPVSYGPTLDVASVVAGLDAVQTKQYDGVAAVPVFDGTVSKVNEIVAAGTPLISYIADSGERSNRTSALGQAGLNAGAAAGEFIAGQLPEGGKVAVITGWFGAPQLDDRMNGAIEHLRANAPDVEILDAIENKDDTNIAYQQASDLITAHQDLRIIYVTGGGPEGAAKAVRDAGLTGDIFVVGYDFLPDRQTYLDQGEMLALVSQQPQRQAFDAIVMLHNIIACGAEYPETVEIGAQITKGKFAQD